MDFKFSDEQEQLRDLLQRFIRKDYSFEKRREILNSAEGYSHAAWQQLAELGVLGLTLPEAHDGLGGTAVDTLVVMEEMGRGLLVEPYLSTVVMGASLLAKAGTPTQQSAVLPKIASGAGRLAFAHAEAGSRYQTRFVSTQAGKAADGYVLSGSKTTVLHAGAADNLIVSARSTGKVDDEAGLSLFLVPRDARGVSLHDYPMHDGHRAGEIKLDKVKIGADALIGFEGKAFGLIEETLDRGIAALCAEAVGAMAMLVEMTLQYVKTRKQFGVPIGSFQVLQHRCADMLMQVEQARSMAYLAAARVDDNDAHARRRALSAAKAVVGQAARFVGQQAVQLHGGIGVTDELAVSHYFKRLTAINATFGDADHHLGVFSDLILKETIAA
jgi:alkylation response protein AidB-like acyl-CoA dehydrogenase